MNCSFIFFSYWNSLFRLLEQFLMCLCVCSCSPQFFFILQESVLMFHNVFLSSIVYSFYIYFWSGHFLENQFVPEESLRPSNHPAVGRLDGYYNHSHSKNERNCGPEGLNELSSESRLEVTFLASPGVFSKDPRESLNIHVSIPLSKCPLSLRQTERQMCFDSLQGGFMSPSHVEWVLPWA